MKNITITLLVMLMFSAVVTSCKKDKNKKSSIEGVWKGTFEREGPVGLGVANVTLEFLDNGFTGTTDMVKYPAICNGTFYLDFDDKVNFENKCVWTADFDWTYVLDGEYSVERNGDSLKIIRGYNGFINWRDVYKLKKQ